jgi:hypothetical protein
VGRQHVTSFVVSQLHGAIMHQGVLGLVVGLFSSALRMRTAASMAGFALHA